MIDLWIEVCQNVVLTKIDIAMTTINKKLEIDKSRVLHKKIPSSSSRDKQKSVESQDLE